MELKNNLLKVEILIHDKGLSFKRIEEIIQKSQLVETDVKRHINKYAHAMGISKKYTFEIISKELIGKC